MDRPASRTLPPLFVLLAPLVAPAAAAAAAPGPEPAILRPAEVGVLEPAASDAPAAPGALPIGAAGLTSIANRDLLDRATMLRLKAAALWNEAAPRGVALPSVEAGAGAFPAPGARAPETTTRFEGVDILSNTDYGLFIPPDTILAAGKDKILEATNGAVRLSGRTGKTPVTTNLTDFFDQPATMLVFDPKVAYDRQSGRFFVIALGYRDSPQQSFIFLGVSKDDSPANFGQGEWCTYKINSRREGSFADYPGLGINEKWLAVSVNNFRYADGFFNTSFIYAIPRASVLPAGGRCPATPRYAGFRPLADSQGFVAFTIQPALHYTPNGLPGNPLFFVNTQFEDPGRQYVLWRLTGTGTADAALSHVILGGTGTYGLPPEAPHLGGPDLDTGDLRVTHVAFRDGKVWAVHATSCALGELPNESCVRAVQITPSEAGGAIAFEETYGGEDWYGFWPSVAINGGGEVVVTFQRSRADRYLDVAYNGKRPADPTFDSIRTLKIGQCPIFDLDGDGRNRTGDYTGSQADPLDEESFWIAGEYAGNLPVVGCSWKTSIARVRYSAAPAGPPAAAPVVGPVAPPELVEGVPDPESPPMPEFFPLPVRGKPRQEPGPIPR